MSIRDLPSNSVYFWLPEMGTLPDPLSYQDMIWDAKNGIFYAAQDDLTWKQVGAGMTSFNLEGDTGTPQTITDGNTLKVSGGIGLSSIAIVPDTVTINLDNTTVTPGSYTNASLTVDAQGRITAASSGSAVIYPTTWTAFHFQATVTVGAPLFLAVTTQAAYNFLLLQIPAAINDQFEHKIFLAAGTYTLFILGSRDSNRGIITWYLNNTAGPSLGTIDQYSPTPIANSIQSIPNINVPTSGVHTLIGKVTSKNSSSSDYFIAISQLWMK